MTVHEEIMELSARFMDLMLSWNSCTVMKIGIQQCISFTAQVDFILFPFLFVSEITFH